MYIALYWLALRKQYMLACIPVRTSMHILYINQINLNYQLYQLQDMGHKKICKLLWKKTIYVGQ